MRTRNVMKKFCIGGAAVFLLFVAVGYGGAAPKKGEVSVSQSREKYPAKPVRFVITHKPGGANDKPIRLIQPYLDKALGVPVILENMDGAGGNIARAYVQKQAPDGYTFLISQQPSLSSGAYSSGGQYEPLKFVPVFNIAGKSYMGVAVPYSSPYKTVKELVEASKKTPLTLSGAGVGAGSFITYVLLQKAGAKLQYVPFNSAPEAVMALAGKQVDIGVTNYEFFLPLQAQQKVRLIGVTGPARGEFAPEVLTLTEQGVPGIEVDQIVGAFAPPGFPKDKLNIMAAAFAKASQDEAFKEAAKKAKTTLHPLGPEEYKKEFLNLHKIIEDIAPLLKEASKN